MMITPERTSTVNQADCTINSRPLAVGTIGAPAWQKRLLQSGVALALWLLALLPATGSATAAEPVPGGSCSGLAASSFQWAGGPENFGTTNGMFCVGNTWKGVINFQSSGRVGIGTSTPATTLDVNGDITSRNVTSCAMLGTDSTGKLVCKTPAITLISTQTASASASLQWTGLGNTYAYLRLVCSYLVNATGGTLDKVQFGEGATPTWKTTAYSVSFLSQDTSFNNDPYASTNYSGIPITNTGPTGGFTSFDMMLYQPGASGIYKSVTFTGMNSLDGASTGQMAAGGGYYHGDTNPLTAIRVLPSSGNITSGQCSLYGITQ